MIFFPIWRTKEGEEIDFLIEMHANKIIAIDAKMGGQRMQLSKECLMVPIAELHDYLMRL